MPRVAPVLLVVLVALAGCNGILNDGGAEGEVFTPAAVPTDAPTPTPRPQLAPGLTAEGVVDASALAAAHDALLENTSFTVQRTVTYRTQNGTPVRRVTSVTRIGRDGRLLVTKRWNGTTTLRREAYYYDGKRLLVATTTDTATTYHRVSPATATLRRLVATGMEQIERIFSITETRVAGRMVHNGTTMYRLVSARNQSEKTTPLGRSVSARARITTRGFVRAYTFRQTLSGEGSDGTAVIVVSTQYTGVGSTTVERPVWYDEALSETNATNRTTVSDVLRG